MPSPNKDSYTIIYAAIICLACSLLLSVAASSLKKLQDYNVEIDRKMNVLKAFGIPILDENNKRIKPEVVEKYFAENISEISIDATTGLPVDSSTAAQDPLLLYLWSENGQVSKYAFPISGKGLWSTIYGYMALERDLATISGITFYKHGETPGLGAEVETDWFQNNFKGKKILANGERLKFEVVKGKVSEKYPAGNDHAVDGISGATITGNGVAKFMNAALDKYETYFKLQRGI